MAVGVQGNAVQDVGGAGVQGVGQQAGAVYGAFYLAGFGIDDHNHIREVHVGPDFTANPFQFVQVAKRLAVQGYLQFALRLQMLIQEVQVGRSVAGDELLAVRREPPAFPRVVERLMVGKRGCVVTESHLVGPGEHVQLVPQDDGSFAEVFAGQAFVLDGHAAFQVHGADAAFPELAGCLIEHAVMEKEALGIGRHVVRIFLHHFQLILFHLRARAGTGATERQEKKQSDHLHRNNGKTRVNIRIIYGK